MLRVLTLTSLFPNSRMPRHGIFVLERLRQLRRRHPVEVTVVAPVPWMPRAGTRRGRWAEFSRVPEKEQLDGILVYHPRFLAIPWAGRFSNPIAFASASHRCLELNGLSDFDVIDAHYAFPDGVGAIMLSARLGKPIVLTVRGSDIHVHGRETAARWWLKRALPRASAVIAVSDALSRSVAELDPAVKSRLHVLRNGVDLDRFTARPDCISSRGLEKTILSVGNLVPLKGHDLVIRALRDLPNVRLVIVGSGPQAESLHRTAIATGVAERVEFVGTLDQESLIDMYNVADALVLASSSEGMPNVILEGMACGTPVIATDVSDNRQLLHSRDAGRIVKRTPEDIARGVREVLQARIPRERVRTQALGFGWTDTCDGLMEILRSANQV